MECATGRCKLVGCLADALWVLILIGYGTRQLPMLRRVHPRHRHQSAKHVTLILRQINAPQQCLHRCLIPKIQSRLPLSATRGPLCAYAHIIIGETSTDSQFIQVVLSLLQHACRLVPGTCGVLLQQRVIQLLLHVAYFAALVSSRRHLRRKELAAASTTCRHIIIQLLWLFSA